MLLEGRIPGVVTWVGTLLGGVGLYLTFKQAKFARVAAEDTARTVRELDQRTRLSRLADTIAQLDALRGMIDSGHHAAALTLLAPLRRSLVLASAARRQEDASRAAEVTRRAMATIDAELRLAAAANPKYKAMRVVKALAGLDETVADINMILVASETGERNARY